MTREDASRVPDLVLERYRLGELPPTEREALEGRLEADEALRQRLEALDRSDAEIRRRYPPEWLAGRVRSRLRPRVAPAPRPGVLRHWPIPAALAVAATVLLVMAPQLVGPPAREPGAAVAPTTGTGDRVKGLRPSLVLFRRTPSGSEALAEGDRVRAGDLLRIGYRAAGQAYGVILSIDGRGGVTLHLPAQGEHAAALGRDGTVLLDRAYELDDAPRFERFYLITASRPFAVAPVVAAARRVATGGPAGTGSATLDLTGVFQQSVFSLEKGARP